jgi:hypothetical protein
MKIRLYTDEDSMQRALVRALRSHDVDVLTPVEAKMVDRDDVVHLEYAKSMGRVLCTYNVKDFAQLHSAYMKSQKSHAGMILMRQQEYSLGESMRRILKLIATLSAEDMKDRIEYLGGWK